ncbi:histidinol-phosphate transaminase [Micromonospora sp. R77]|uniref:histidinol-phosphate transaminase n=1 Tax=Micromonospora sp. R77 TaxID=2925836 RepID=UPI001F610B16|nr:histidinol-phosphate transaminase [Micromonospora sp. R77]MCI4066884.1 histidinol-phosphate transaminase [Micromonospora sp. R77]
MSVAVRAELAALPPYVIPRQPPGAVLLNSNESPAAPPDPVVAAVTRAAATLHRYPDWTSGELVGRLSRGLDVDPARVAVGCGSVSLCQQLLQVVCGPGAEVVHPWRSFEAYPVMARIVGAVPVAVPLDGGQRHDLPAMLRAITPATRAVFVCNPNNPTGTTVTRAALREFLAEVPGDVLVVLDEAYREFVTDPDVPDGLDLAATRDNVAVLRTFSKAYRLAGVRIGYCVAAPEVAAAVRAVGVPFAVSRLAEAAALAALDVEDELRRRCRATVGERDRVAAALLRRGHSPVPSQANFLWLPLGARAVAFGEHCAARNVLLRVFPGDGARVTIGAPAENDAFLRATEGFAP